MKNMKNVKAMKESILFVFMIFISFMPFTSALQKTPFASIASATFAKPARLAPWT